MRPMGASSFCGSYTAILQPHLDCGRGLRPLSFAANGTRAKGTDMNYSKPKSVNMPEPSVTFAATGSVKTVYGENPSLGLKDCVKNLPLPNPLMDSQFPFSGC